jgi:acyl dehydratase
MVAQVWPGDSLVAQVEVVEVGEGTAELSLRTVNQLGTVVLEGAATVRARS